MTITGPVQSAFGGGTAGTSYTITLGAAPGVGNSLILVANNYDQTNYITGVSGGGVTWVLARQNRISGSGNGTAEIWYGLNSTGVGTVITVTVASTPANDAYAAVNEYAGITAFDTENGFSNTVGVPTSPTLSLAGSGELVVAAVALQSGAGTPYGNSFVSFNASYSALGYADACYLIGNTGSTSFGSTSQNSAITIAAFKSAATPTASGNFFDFIKDDGGGPLAGLGYQLGLNDHDLLYASSAVQQQVAGLLAAAGVTVHRCDLLAADITNTAMVTQWATNMRAAGIQPMIVVTFGTPWTALPNTTTFASDMATLVAACPGLWWEIGNEPDQGTIAASAYVPFFSAAVTAMKAADSTCKVGPCPISNVNGGGGGTTWLAAAFAAGLAAILYDFLPFHNYPWPTSLAPTTPWSGPYSAITLIPQFTVWATAQGNTKPYWMTECGWQSVDGPMTPALQSSYMVAFLQAITGYGLVVVIPYELSDGGGETYGWMNTVGGDYYNNPKPVYTAVEALVTG